ncbi:chemotaxis protein MotC [Microvirga subterranea]|uniref:Chemotaxis protein MotC n=1 Tax=Microvirga subterranea TaxID=186651 RepID=A0A370HCN1_9HYPH|nr:chemotaxis protein MotC [Microvirga subterranea]RDI54829.1 chemotaxis protein MotC [Microvirga subterranea]
MRPPALSFALAALLIASTAHAEPGGPQTGEDRMQALPVEMVRTLQIMQDQVATGSTTAHVAQRTLLGHIDERFAALDMKVWDSSKNVRAAVVFVLSGGRPHILRKLASLNAIGASDRSLVQGALAYVEGREGDAKHYLAEIDLASLPPALAGQVALVQSALTVRDDPAKSVELLDYVRLLVPGTLIEEAALRREIFVVSQMGNVGKFEALSRQYLRRFRSSVYAGNFRQRFATALSHLDFAKDQQQFPRLVAILSELDVDSQRDLYLLIARSAVDQGQTKAAILASDKAYELATSDIPSATRAKLYKAAAVIVTAEGFENGVAELRKIDRELLSQSDAALLESALSLAGTIRKVPEKVATAAAGGPPLAAGEPSQIEVPLPAISRAQKALERVDQLFRK